MKPRRWENREVEYLKNNWNHISTKEIAENLNRTIGSVRSKAHVLGLGEKRITPHKRWTQEELNYLMDSWGTLSIETIANKLGRTKGAVQQKASKEGLGPFLEAGDYISLNILYRALRGNPIGTGGYTINQWTEKGLPVMTKKVKGSSFKVINLDEFWKWAEKNLKR